MLKKILKKKKVKEKEIIHGHNSMTYFFLVFFPLWIGFVNDVIKLRSSFIYTNTLNTFEVTILS